MFGEWYTTVMTLTGHALDHLLDNILNTGPPMALWEFVTEHSMGKVAQGITSHTYPFSQLANMLLQQEQLKAIWMMYPDMSDELNFSGQGHDWNDMSHAETYFPEISELKSNPIMKYIDYRTLNTSIDDWVVLQTPHGWYQLTLTEKVVFGAAGT